MMRGVRRALQCAASGQAARYTDSSGGSRRDLVTLRRLNRVYGGYLSPERRPCRGFSVR